MHRLYERLRGELESMEEAAGKLRARVDLRYGEQVIDVEFDQEAASVRVAMVLPPPAGGGVELLLWCLSTNLQYWDVKLGIDEQGFLVVHSDLDADDEKDLAELAEEVLDRAETIIELVDDDYTQWLWNRGLGTPAQRKRWVERQRPAGEAAS
ncbi:MAG: hypothetical protein ACPGUV_13145 [Polyangiales bacterium]